MSFSFMSFFKQITFDKVKIFLMYLVLGLIISSVGYFVDFGSQVLIKAIVVGIGAGAVAVGFFEQKRHW